MDRETTLNRLETVERNIAHGERYVRAQMEILADLERLGHADTAKHARALLNAFEVALAAHVAERDQLRKALL